MVELANDWPGNPIVLDPRGKSIEESQAEKRAAFGAANYALAASGTVSLELAASGTPMVIAYDMSWLSWQIMSRMLRTDTVTLVNLVSGERVIQEFLGPACQPPAITNALSDLMRDTQAMERQTKAMADTMQKLGKGSEPPGLRAAKAVLDGLSNS